MEKRGMRYGFVAMLFSMLIALAAFAPSTAFADVTVNNKTDLQQALDNGGEVTLGDNITGSVTVPSGKTVTLNLNGHTLTADQKYAAITNNGTLTIAGPGTVDGSNLSQTAAIYNAPSGVANLNGGTFTGSKWYVIKNLGTMTIDGASVAQDDAGSSAIDNGYFGNAGNDCGVSEPSSATVSLTIINGSFSGGMNVVKNDDFGVLSITGGTFTNTDGPAVLNWNKATIDGGDFSVNNSASGVIVNGSYGANSPDKGELIINAGTFTAPNNGSGNIFAQGQGGTSGGTVVVSGGSYNGSLDNLSNLNVDVEVSGGSFTDAAVAKYVKSGNVAMSANQGNGFQVVSEETAEANAAAKVQNGDSVIYFANIEDAKKFAEDNHIDPSFVEQLRFVITYVDGLTDAAYGPTCIVPAGQKLTKAAIDTPDGEELVPAKEGYTFTGWYLDKELTQKATFPFEPNSDMELYAGFSKNDPAVNPSQGDNKTTTTTTKTSSAKTGDNLALFGGLLALVAVAGATAAVVAVRHRKSE